MSESAPMPASRMATTFEHVIRKHYVSNSLIFIGLLLIILGIVIAVWPEILVGVMVVALVAIGITMLVGALFLRRLAPRMQTLGAEFRGMRRDSPLS